jgi:hypothetical protein
MVARGLAAAGKPVSRRALRSGGVTGSNEALNALARLINAEMAGASGDLAGQRRYVIMRTCRGNGQQVDDALRGAAHIAAPRRLAPTGVSYGPESTTERAWLAY